MRLAYLLLYLVVEIGVFVAMTMTLGFGWAVLITIAAAALGFVMLRWQGAKVFGDLRRASRNEVDARAPLADTAIMAGSTFLLIIPGVVSTLIGIVLLAPPTRRVMRPALAAFGARRMVVAMDRAGLYATSGFRRGRVIDGDVVDSGVRDSGVRDSGVRDSAVNDGGVIDTSVVDSSVVHSSVVHSPVVDSSAASTSGRQLPRGH